MRGLDSLRELASPSPEVAAVDRLADVGKTMRGDAAPVSETAPPAASASNTHIVAKVTDGNARDAAAAMLGAGARRDGKRLVLSLGSARVTYAHGEFVGKTERGLVEVIGADALDVIERIGLSGLLGSVEEDG